MKKTLIIILSILPLVVICQNELFISSGSTITANSSVTLTDADLTNNGTYNGALKMNGISTDVVDTFIYNNGTILFSDLDISGNNTINLENDAITINENINLNSDDAILILGSANITLSESATINNEDNNRAIRGAPGTYITTMRNHNTTTPIDFGNIGFEITNTANSLGNTTVFRNYGVLNINSNETIRRYYTIQPTNTSDLDIDARFYFTDSDLNGLEKASLNLFQSTDGTTNWMQKNSMLIDDTYPYIETSGAEELNVWAIVEGGALGDYEFSPETFSIYPNPAKNTIYFITPKNTIINNIIITDVLGKIKKLTSFENNKIDIEQLSSGIYYLTFLSLKGEVAQKLIIKR